MSAQVAAEVPPCSHEKSQKEAKAVQPEENVTGSLRAEYTSKIWDGYINDILIGSNHVSEAAIIDKDSGKYLASSPGFKLHKDEFVQILASLSHVELAYRNGVTVNRRYYKTRLADGSRGIFARTDSDGCSVCQTATLVIIGVHDEKCKPYRCNEEVMDCGTTFSQRECDYLWRH